MSAGEGYVWTLNQGTGTVTKIDPSTLKVVATIQVGVPGGGGDIRPLKAAVWVTHARMSAARASMFTPKVTHQFVGPGGDGMRVLHGSIFLSNGRCQQRVAHPGVEGARSVPMSWTTKAHNG
jgi:YVTN family beta-propeller protein